MGDWRRVHIVGICDSSDISNLYSALTLTDDNFHCLVHSEGLCGLPNWAKEDIDVVGNLAERDYTPFDVAEQLEKLLLIAPSLRVDIHCGREYESEICEHTVRVLSDDTVEILLPQEEIIPELDNKSMRINLLTQLIRQRRKHY